MKKFKKKFLKTFSVFLVVICLVFSSCLSSSALTTVNFVSNRPTVTENSCYFEIVTDTGACYIFYVSAGFYTLDNYDTVDFERLSFTFISRLENGSLWINPYDLYLSSGDGVSISEDFYCYGSIISQDGSISSATTDSSGRVGIYIGENYRCLRGYNVDCSTRGSDYVFTYSNEININNKLDSIIDILQNGGFTQIGALIGKATQDTDKLLENQEQYQDEILNGWQPDDDVDFDSSLNDDYSDLDKELIDSTADGRAEADEVFDNFDSLLETEDDNPETPASHNHLTNGLLCVTAIFNEFTKIDWLHNILTFSLALGVFAFVIGTASAVFKSAHEKHEYKKASKKSSFDDS